MVCEGKGGKRDNLRSIVVEGHHPIMGISTGEVVCKSRGLFFSCQLFDDERDRGEKGIQNDIRNVKKYFFFGILLCG